MAEDAPDDDPWGGVRHDGDGATERPGASPHPEHRLAQPDPPGGPGQDRNGRPGMGAGRALAPPAVDRVDLPHRVSHADGHGRPGDRW